MKQSFQSEVGVSMVFYYYISYDLLKPTCLFVVQCCTLVCHRSTWSTSDLQEGLCKDYLQPLAAMLFPELVGPKDADGHYAFTVQYEPDGDTELAKHGDASVVTINLCLGPKNWEGSSLRFFESGGSGMYQLPKGNESAGAGDVVFHSGMAVIHRGQHQHQAQQLLSGQRVNLVVWLHSKDGVVRIAPYAPEEQMTVGRRWHTRHMDL